MKFDDLSRRVERHSVYGRQTVLITIISGGFRGSLSDTIQYTHRIFRTRHSEGEAFYRALVLAQAAGEFPRDGWTYDQVRSTLMID